MAVSAGGRERPLRSRITDAQPSGANHWSVRRCQSRRSRPLAGCAATWSWWGKVRSISSAPLTDRSQIEEAQAFIGNTLGRGYKIRRRGFCRAWTARRPGDRPVSAATANLPRSVCHLPRRDHSEVNGRWFGARNPHGHPATAVSLYERQNDWRAGRRQNSVWQDLGRTVTPPSPPRNWWRTVRSECRTGPICAVREG